MLDFLTNIFTSQWQVLAFSIVLLVAATEFSYRYGLHLHRTHDEGRKSQIGGIQAAILGLLALLLGFTFAMAVGRYETRRTLVVQEANAIGTTYLRASLLPAPQQDAVEKLLREYVAVRLSYFDAGQDTDELANVEGQAAALQRDLWQQAVAAAVAAPTPIVATFITSLNETINLDATRLNALRTHVPGAVWLIVLAVATCGCYVSGYAAGASGARSAFSSCVLPLLVALVIALIVDLDHPRGGLISIRQQPLLDLQQEIAASPPSPALQ